MKEPDKKQSAIYSSKVSIIFKREFKAYFNSPIAYIVLIVFLMVAGWFFASNIFISQQATISPFVNIIPLLLLFIIPGITMRTIAEEERNGTIELLRTLPVRDYEVLAGKFLAALALIAIGIGLTLFFPVTTQLLGNIDWGEVFCSYIAIFFVAGLYISIGLFASSFLKNQITAYIITFIISFVFYLIGKILPIVPGPLVSTVEYLSLDYHFENMARGLLDTRNIIYFLSFIAVFLIASYYIYRRTKERIFPVANFIVILAIIFVLNNISYRLFFRFDLTEGNIYSLSPVSKKLVRNLNDNLIIKSYITQNLPAPYNFRAKYLDDMLSEYRIFSHGKVRYYRIHPKGTEGQKEAVQAGIYPLAFNEIKSDEYGIKQGFIGLTLQYGDKREVIPVVNDISSIERDVTVRLRKLTGVQKKKIAVIGNVTIPPKLAELVRDQYTFTKVDLSNEDIPSDCNSMVVIAPRKRFSATEISKIGDFIKQGHTAGFFLDRYIVNLQKFFVQQNDDNLDSLLNTFNISIKKGLVYDLQCQTVALQSRKGQMQMTNFIPYPFFPKVTHFDKNCPITKDLESVTFPFVSPVLGGTPVALSSKNSVLLDKIFLVSPLMKFPVRDTSYQRGPLPVAATVISDKGRIFVCGTGNFLDRNFANLTGYTFFLNVCDWLLEDEDLIAIRSKAVIDRPLKHVGTATHILIKYINMFFPSVILIIFGLIRWRRRKRLTYEI